MPKAYDTSCNYYADLDLPATASIDDVKKQYRKLVLQYHPDRNIGKEDEAVPKFQAVQAAHEILSDPTQKSKYDQDRQKASLYGRGGVSRTQTQGNPYQANSQYPPPPRRTQPGTWQRPPSAYPAGGAGAAGAPGSGADRFSNFPRAAPTAKQRADPAQDRTNMFKAWQNMQTNGQRPAGPAGPAAPGAGGPGAAPRPRRQRPPPPPRPDTKMPSEDEIRAGMNYRKPPPSFDQTEEKQQSAWQAFQQASAGKSGMPRSRSTKTPKKAGFDPNAPGSDERPAGGGHYKPRNLSADMGTGSPFPPPPPGPPPTSNPTSPLQHRDRRPFPDPTQPYMSRDVPYQEGERARTPYASFRGERTDPEGLRRSYSQRDNARMFPEAEDSRPRSTSPMGQRQASAGQAHQNGRPRAPFVVYSDSDSSDLEPELPSSEELSSAGISEQASPDPSSSRPSPAYFGNPADRPKKQPSPPSKRFNGPFAVPHPPQSAFHGTSDSRPQTGDGVHSETEQPSMQQKSNSNMYVDPLPRPFLKTSPFSPAQWAVRMFGSVSTNKTGRRGAASVPKWAVPSSILPEQKKGKVSAGSNSGGWQQTSAPAPASEPPTGADKPWLHATQDERHAYLATQHNIFSSFGSVARDFDIEVFLRLASTVRRGESSGNVALDGCILRSLSCYPSVGYSIHLDLHANSKADSFTFPINHETFKSTANGKSRSEENINTKFTDGEWNGAFTGQGNASQMFAPPPPTVRQNRSPQMRSTKGGMRAATTSFGAAPPFSADAAHIPPPPPRPAASDGSPLEATQSAPGGAKASQDEWQKHFRPPTWHWPPQPQPPGPGTSNRGGRRPVSQGAPRTGFSADEAKSQQPYVAPEGVDEVVVEEEPESDEDFGGNDGDAMDIDDASSMSHPDGASAASNGSKGPRMVSVPPSPWRAQAAANAQANGHNRSSSAPKPMYPPKLNTNLDDLAEVEPLAKSAADGLRNFQDLSASLPFTSQASATLPTQSLDPQNLQTPPVPRAPEPPQRLSKASWHAFAHAFGGYLRAFHTFNGLMLLHFQTREIHAEQALAGDMSWLEAAGDTAAASNGPHTGTSGFGQYLQGVREDVRVRGAWVIGCERHETAVKGFEDVRQRVKKLAMDGVLMDA